MNVVEARRLLDIASATFAVNPSPLDGQGTEAEVLNEAERLFTPVTRAEELASLLPSESKPVLGHPPRVHLYLPTMWKSGVQVPVLTWKFDFSEETLKLSLYLALLQRPVVPGEARFGPLQAMGLRFESPEGTDDEPSAHGYWHTQITRGFTRDRPLMDGGRHLCPEGLPESNPALPVPAATPAELFLCMLISLYGRAIRVGKAQSALAIRPDNTVRDPVYRRMGLL